MSTMKKRIPMFLLALAMMVAMALLHLRIMATFPRLLVQMSGAFIEL